MAARAGLINNTYPWGNDAPSNEKPNMPMFNHWPGKKFNPKSKKQIKSNIAFDGFHGVAPAKHYIPNHTDYTRCSAMSGNGRLAVPLKSALFVAVVLLTASKVISTTQ